MLNDQISLRIKTLEGYDALDTTPEQMFDDITAIASSICNMPIALISLLDDKRQFFKSHLGISISETPIEFSFCVHAIEKPENIFIVEDARLDERFKNNPFVTSDPNIVSYYGMPLSSGNGIAFGTLCVIDNKVNVLTEEQKKALQSLSRQVVHLLELRRANKLLRSYQTQLENYSSRMEDFAYMAAHDLKAPVRTIGSLIKLIEENHKAIWDEQDEMYFDFLYESLEKMNTLILDLLDFAKVNTVGEESKEKINLNELISGVFEMYTTGIATNKPILNCPVLPEIISSKIILTVLFQNLIGNAIKYQAKNNVPKIDIAFSETEKEWIFTVQDNGIGIKEEHLTTIFKPFKRLHSQSEFAGSGLGLAACKKLIDNLNGKIWVSSVPGEGTKVNFSIPK